MKIYITGISGTGKTSLARALVTHGVNAVDLDSISHWENKETKEVVEWEPGSDEFMDSHDWICDLVKLKEIISRTENAVALGHTSNQEQYLPFFEKIFVLSCSPETITTRLNSRTDNDFGKHPADLARILNWQIGFQEWMVEKGASVIDCERPLEQVVQEIEKYLK